MPSAIVGALKVILSADTAEYKSAMQQAGKEAASLSREFGAVGRQMTAVGSALTKTITLPILAVGVGAVKAAADFESSFANVAKTVDGVSDSSGTLTAEGQQLAQTFRDLAKEIPATTDELNAIAALGGQMGVPIGQLEHFTRNVAALSVAVDGISAEEAAAGLAQIGNATGQGTSKIQEMASTLVHLGNSSNATEGQILEFTKRLIGAGHSAGMTVPQVMAIGTAMANVGINAEAGGTAMSTVIAKIGKAVSTGGADLRQFASVAGKSAAEFSEVWKRSSAEGIDLFVKGLSSMRQRGVDLNLTMGELGTEGIRVASTLKLLAGAGDGVATSLVIANAGYADGNKHLEEANKKYATFHNQLKLLWNQIKDVGIELGNALLPALKSLVQVAQQLTPVVQALVVALTSLPTWMQASIVGAVGLAAAIGPVMWAVGTLTTAVGTVIGAFKAKGIAMRAITALMGSTSTAAIALRGALAFLGPVAAVVATAFASWHLGKWIGEVTGLTNVVGYLTARLGELVGLLPKGAAAQYTATVRAQQAAEAAKKQAKALDQVVDATNDLGTANEFVGPILDRNANSLDDYAEAADDAKKKAEAFADSLKKLGGRDALSGAQEVVRQLHALNGPLNVLPSKLQEMAARLREGADAALLMGRAGLADQYTKLADTLNPIIQFQQRYNVTIGEYVTRADDAAVATDELWAQFHRLTGQVQLIGPTLLSSTMNLSAMFDPLKAAVKQVPGVTDWDRAWANMKIGLQNTLDDIPGTLQKAFTGGGGIMGALKAIGVQLVSAFTTPIMEGLSKLQKAGVSAGTGLAAALGGATGGGTVAAVGGIASSLGGAAAAAGMFGTAMTGTGIAATVALGAATMGIGAAAVGVALLIKKFATVPKEVKLARQEVDKFTSALHEALTPSQIKEAGGQAWKATAIAVRDAYLTIGRTAEEAEAQVRALWNTDNPERSRQAMVEINAVLQESRVHVEGLQTALGNTRSEFDGLVGKARELGYEFDQNGQFVSVNFEKMREVAQQFGVDLASLGPAFQSQQILTSSSDIINAFTLMQQGGADVGTILFGLKDEIGKIVGDSMQFGTTIPANMKPWIEELIRTDQLVDENGVAITDLSQIKFGDPVKSEFEKISTALLEVVERLGAILDQIAAIPTNKTLTVEASYYDPGPPAGFGDPDREGREDPGFAVGTMGRLGQWFGNFGAAGFDTALHGMEAVVTPQQAVPFAMDVMAGMGGGGTTVDFSGLETRLGSVERLLRDQPTQIAHAVQEVFNFSGGRR